MASLIGAMIAREGAGTTAGSSASTRVSLIRNRPLALWIGERRSPGLCPFAEFHRDARRGGPITERRSLEVRASASAAGHRRTPSRACPRSRATRLPIGPRISYLVAAHPELYFGDADALQMPIPARLL